tara:strand:+ start:2083 stop:2520 length:438 start_codon:yes stop_codon:yes gene_type:complete
MKINEFIDSLKIKEIDDDMRDLGLDGPDSADDDEAGMDKGYSDKHIPLINQVHKVKDSQGNPNPIKMVSTEDGGKFKITGWQADLIIQMLTGNYNQKQKMEFTKDVNTKKEVLGGLLDTKSPKDMVAKFKELVNPEMREPSAYER